jgi:hypothetical protein
MLVHLPRTHTCHFIFHSLHFYLVIWGHLLPILILCLTLIKTVTICHLFFRSQILVYLKPLPLPLDLNQHCLIPIIIFFYQSQPIVYLATFSKIQTSLSSSSFLQNIIKVLPFVFKDYSQIKLGNVIYILHHSFFPIKNHFSKVIPLFIFLLYKMCMNGN